MIGGMHRSGTSLLASLFEGAGVSVGERLMGSGPGNEAGHFEDLDFYEFHQRALAGNGLSAEGFTADGVPTVPDILHAEAAELVARRRERGGIWGWKDPRTVLFLDFWAELLPDARYVFVFRSPGEVVDSFFRRGDPTFVFHPLLAARVWLHYNRLILDFVARHPEHCLIRETTQIAADPGELFAAIRQRLGVPVGEPPSRYRADLLGHDADGHRTRLVAEACPGAMDAYLELRARAGSTDPLPEATGPTASETAIVEWARAARFERENAEVRREWVALRARTDAEAAVLRARLASWGGGRDRHPVVSGRDQGHRLRLFGASCGAPRLRAAPARRRRLTRLIVTPVADTPPTPIDAGRGLRAAARGIAWAAWLGLLVVSTAVGLFTVEAVARPEFTRQRKKNPDTVAPVGRFLAPVPLADGMIVKQEFEVDRDGLSGIRVRAVTWGTTPDPHECIWLLQDIGPDGASRRVIRSGTFSPERLNDWEFIALDFDPITNSGGRRFAIKFKAGMGRPAKFVGLPLFETAADHAVPVVRASDETEPRPLPTTATLHLKLVHADPGG